MQQTMQRFKEKLQSNDATLDKTTRIRAAAALIALFSMLVPWVWMDGDKSALSGADLLAYAFTSDERGALFRTSILGALGLFFVPPIVAVLTIYGFAKTIMGEYPLMANLMGALLPIIMLILARSITSSDQLAILGITLSGWGVSLMICSHTGLFIHGVLHGEWGKG